MNLKAANRFKHPYFAVI